MKELRRNIPIRKLAVETRVIYSMFLALCLFAYVIMAIIAAQRAGMSVESMTQYYIGDESKGVYGKTYGEIVELTHFHLFSIPVLLFLQGHIFLLTSWSLRNKYIVIGSAFLAGAVYIATPWLVVYGSADLAILGILARYVLAVTFLLFFAVPIKEMWQKDSPH